MPRHGMVDMHKPSLILLTLPRQPEWLAVCAKSQGEEEEKEEGEEEDLGERSAGLDWVELGWVERGWAELG